MLPVTDAVDSAAAPLIVQRYLPMRQRGCYLIRLPYNPSPPTPFLPVANLQFPGVSQSASGVEYGTAMTSTPTTLGLFTYLEENAPDQNNQS